MTTNKKEASCPYAAALHLDECSDGDESTDTSKLILSCPAFERGSCPFAGCADDDAVRKALLQVPKSHFEGEKQGKQFISALQELHTITAATATANVDSKFQFKACPVTSKVHVPTSPTAAPVLNFTQAMDGYSLAAIMARMAEEMEAEDHPATSTVQIRQEPTPTTTAMRRSSSHLRLSESFKTGTAVSHQAAEDVHFVRNFIRGQIDRKLYAELVVQLYHVYDTLEGCLATAADSGLEQFRDFHKLLQRQETLKEDLDFWHGPVVAEQIVTAGAGISPAATDYVMRLKHCAATDPLLLLAHSYTRYLGDLSGGKILARVARKAMGLDGNEGLAFYDFEEIPSAKKFKDAYRTALDALDLTDADITKLVAEANIAFLLNMRLFEELDVAANFPGATVRPLAEALSYAEQRAATTCDADNDKPKECPFAKLSASTKEAAHVEDAPGEKIPDECPFAKAGATNSEEGTVKKDGRCPWPFILAHDPVAALQDWQTWVLVGLILCYAWSKLQQ
jgi:heme oxygenase (biliverdin-producing, ferredoxin)